jgi:predicted TIM-barrel fold metal-dependent hydrolase
MQKYPDILIGFALPELGPEVDGPEAIDRFRDQGFTGLKFIAPSYAYDDERYYPLYERAEQLDMPILYHTGFLSIGSDDGARGISQDKMRAVRLDTIGRAYPRLRMMMAHLGNPEFHVGLDVIRSFDHIYGEFSGASGSKFRETVLRRVFAPLPGADMADPEENLALIYFQKLCFATDNPEPPRWIELSQRLMDELALPAELQERFWWKNGATWLGIEGGDDVP